MSTTTSNLKQRFIRLLRKFKLPETEAFESEEQYKGYMEQVMAQNESDFLDDDDIGDFSDSGQEFDDISISSTPKPSLKPYFSTWTLEGSTSVNGGAEAAPTTSNIHPTTSPLSSSSLSTTTTTTTITTTTTTTTITTTTNTVNTPPGDKKSSKLRRILRKRDSKETKELKGTIKKIL
uniref:Uncharacterized protein n=1 Tax=Tetranychus urticae TaxID=32264 RepID=T1JPP4_TETUR